MSCSIIYLLTLLEHDCTILCSLPQLNFTAGIDLQASFLTKRVNLNGKRVNLAIWDTAGQERFHALGPIYYRESHGAVLVYDITDQDSFQKVNN